MKTKPFDVFLKRIDDEAKELDGRSYNPRREEIKNCLSDLINEVGTDAGEEFTREIITILEKERVPSSHQIRYIEHQIYEEYSTPAGDEGPYSLYRDDY